MEQINATAAPRIGLLGNPSDLYEGRGLGFTCDGFSASVSLSPHPTLDLGEGDGASAPMAPLFRAAWAAFRESALQLVEPDWSAEGRRSWSDRAELLDGVPAFAVRARSDIPRQVGLAGSSALITAFLRAVARWHGLALPAHRLAWMAWDTEQRLLGITAGPMDRLVQAHEGLLAMDFRRPWDPVGTRRLDPDRLPPLLLAWDREPGRSSGAVHADLHRRWRDGDPEVREQVAGWAPLVDAGCEALGRGDVERLADLVDANFDLRARLFPIGDRDQALIDLGRAQGAGTKFCGSGGAVLVLPREPDQLDALETTYAAAGFGTHRPSVVGPRPPAGRLRLVVLAAGFATRLYPLTRDRAKPLLEVGGQAMLTRLVSQAAATGALHDVVVVHNRRFAADMLRWRAGLPAGLPAVRLIDNGVADEAQARGAVADLALALERSPPAAEGLGGHLVVAGDNLLDLSLEPVVRRFLAEGRPRLLVRQLAEPVVAGRYGEVLLDGQGRVLRFREKPARPESPYAPLAVYLLPPDLPSLVERYLERPGAERDAPGHLLAWLCDACPVQAEPVGGRWFDVGNTEQLEAARRWAERWS